MNQPSYTSGRQDVALLATTVGDAFDATVAHHAEREALVVRHQRLRYSWRQLAERVDTSDEWIIERTGIKRRHIAAFGDIR